MQDDQLWSLECTQSIVSSMGITKNMAPALTVRKWEDGSSTQVLLQSCKIVNNMKCHSSWETQRERERSLFELGLKRREAKQRKEWGRTIRKAIRRHSRQWAVGTITASNPNALFLLEHATHRNITCHISNYVTCFIFFNHLVF